MNQEASQTENQAARRTKLVKGVLFSDGVSNIGTGKRPRRVSNKSSGYEAESGARTGGLNSRFRTWT